MVSRFMTARRQVDLDKLKFIIKKVQILGLHCSCYGYRYIETASKCLPLKTPNISQQ